MPPRTAPRNRESPIASLHRDSRGRCGYSRGETKVRSGFRATKFICFADSDFADSRLMRKSNNGVIFDVGAVWEKVVKDGASTSSPVVWSRHSRISRALRACRMTPSSGQFLSLDLFSGCSSKRHYDAEGRWESASFGFRSLAARN